MVSRRRRCTGSPPPHPSGSPPPWVFSPVAVYTCRRSSRRLSASAISASLQGMPSQTSTAGHARAITSPYSDPVSTTTCQHHMPSPRAMSLCHHHVPSPCTRFVFAPSAPPPPPSLLKPPAWQRLTWRDPRVNPPRMPKSKEDEEDEPSEESRGAWAQPHEQMLPLNRTASLSRVAEYANRASLHV